MKGVKLFEYQDIKVGEPFFVRNMLMFPLINPSQKSIEVLTYEEMRQKGIGDIVETGSVNTALLEYHGDKPLFMLDGEELLGAYQNRVVNTAVWAETEVVATIPVSCVEELRWSGSDRCAPSGVSVYPTLRALLATTVTQSLRRRRTMSTRREYVEDGPIAYREEGVYRTEEDMREYRAMAFRADQRRVWRTMYSRLSSLEVPSSTRSFHSMVVKFKDETERYIEEIKETEIGEDVVGLAAFAGDKLLSIDIFISNEMLKKFYRKLMTGYALDAIEFGKKKTRFRAKEDLARIMKTLFEEALFEVYDGPVHGKDLRYENDKYTARGTLDMEGNLIHVSAFEKPEID